MGKHGLFVEVQQPVHILPPVVEGELFALLHPQFRLFQEDDHQPVESVHFVAGKVVLGHGHIVLAHPRAAPVGERHVGGVGVGTGDDDLGGGLAGNGKQQLVLGFGKEELGGTVVGPIVGTEREKVAHLLVKALLGGADLADAGQQLVEVVPAAGVLEPLVVHDEALDQILGQVGGGPLAELGAARRAHPVAHRQDHVQVVMLGLVALAVLGSCQVFLDN